MTTPLKTIISHVLVYSIFALMCSLAFVTHAQKDPTTTVPSAPTTDGFTVKITNPLGDKSIDSLPALITLVLDLTVKILSPIIVLVIIWTGFQYVQARGNSTEITKVHQSLIWVLIGAAVILGAKVIALALEGTISQL